MSKFYLYNGVKLPALPEWDKTVYPYAFIYAIGTNGDGVSSEVYTLIISASNQMVYDSIGIGFRYDAIGITKAISTDGTEWVDRTYDSGGSEYFYVKREEPTDILYIRVAWANFDVLNANGSVYVAASEPVPVAGKFPFREWVGWLIAGLCSRPLPVSVREPVAYLYNGVRLPPIPSHGGMSYELISKDGYAVGGGTAYYAWVTTDPWQKIFYGCSIQSGSSGYCYIYSEDTGNWERVHNWENKTPFDIPKTPTWSNHDVMNSDGTLYLAASDPVPVYE